jgi:hypothetical protein
LAGAGSIITDFAGGYFGITRSRNWSLATL